MHPPALADLDAAFSELLAEGSGALGDPEVVVELERQRNRLKAAVARAVGELDETRAFDATGAGTAAGWLTHRCHLPSSEAKAQVRRGRALRELADDMAAVCEDGEVGPAQAGLLGPLLRDPVVRKAVREHEELLVDQAGRLTFLAFKRALAYLVQLADPEGAEARRARRDASLVQSFDGTWLGQMTLDPIAGAIVRGEIDRLDQAGFEAGWTEATGRLGREPKPHELSRTAAQRRADARVEMARRSAATPFDARIPASLISVLVDFPTMAGGICELANGTPVTPGSPLPHLDEALVERAVWRSPVRVEVSAKARLFKGATRRAIELRDRVCQHRYCEIPASRCQADHILSYREGGPTTQANGRLACNRHNRLRVHGPDWPPPSAGPPGNT